MARPQQINPYPKPAKQINVPLPWTSFIAAIVLRAYSDLQQTDDPARALDALFWLAIGDAPLFLEAVDLHCDPLTPLCKNNKTKKLAFLEGIAP